MKRKERERLIDEIAKKVALIKKPVANYYGSIHEELKVLDSIEGMEGIEYIPSPFEIADYYGIKCKFKRIEGDIPSYVNRRLGTIYISDIFRRESYEARFLCAHELGHYFLQNMNVATMDGGELLAEDIMDEYEANVFTILLMPQIMAGKPWKDYSPKLLNRKMYRRALE